MANVQALQRQGWYLSPEGITECTENGRGSAEDIIKAALNFDLKSIGERHLPDGVNRAKMETVDGPFVMQIQKIRNVTAPKDNEESQTAPPMLKVTLTDGHSNCTAIEMERVTRLGLNTPPGTKLLLQGKVRVYHGFLLLNDSNCKVLGGKVEKLVQNWELKRSLAKHTRAAVTGVEGGPPPFVPFGQRHREPPPPTNNSRKETFRSLEQSKEKKAEDTEFEQLRQASIKAALKDGEGEKKKTFGGKTVSDKDVATIVDMGFNSDMAVQALKQSGSVEDALAILLEQNHYSSNSYRSNDRGRGGRGGRGGSRGGREGPGGERGDRGDDKGRGRRGRDRDDDGEYAQPSRPSGPATLFDFLESKMPKGDASNKAEPHEPPAAQPNNSAPPVEGEPSFSSSASKRSLPNLPPRLQRRQQEQHNQPGYRGGPGYRSGGWEENQSWSQGGRGGHTNRGGRGGHDRGRGSDRGRRGGGRGGHNNWENAPDHQDNHWDVTRQPEFERRGGRNDYRGGRQHDFHDRGGRHQNYDRGNKQHNEGGHSRNYDHSRNQDYDHGGPSDYDRAGHRHGYERGGHRNDRGGHQPDNGRHRHDNDRRGDHDRSDRGNHRYDNNRRHDKSQDAHGSNHWDNSQANTWNGRNHDRGGGERRGGGRPQAENNWTGTQEWVNSSRRYQADWASQGSDASSNWDPPPEPASKASARGDRSKDSYHKDSSKDHHHKDNRRLGHSHDQNDRKYNHRNHNEWNSDSHSAQNSTEQSKASRNEPTSNGDSRVAVVSTSSDPTAADAAAVQHDDPSVIAVSTGPAPPVPQEERQSQEKGADSTSQVPAYTNNTPVVVAAPPVMAAPVLSGMVQTVNVSQPPLPTAVPPMVPGQPMQQTYQQQTYPQQTYPSYQPVYQQAYAQAPQQQAYAGDGTPTMEYAQLQYSQMPHQMIQQMNEMAISSASYVNPGAGGEQPMVSTMTGPPGTQQPMYVAAPVQRQMDNSRQARMWKAGDQCLAKYWQDNKFYSAVVHSPNPNNASLYVQFTDYGNFEEVYLSDVQPIPKQSWMQNYATRPPSAVSTMSSLVAQPMSGLMVQAVPTSSMAFLPTYPGIQPATDQPYQGSIGTMEFYASGNPAAPSAAQTMPYANRQQQPQRRPQQVYTSSRTRPM